MQTTALVTFFLLLFLTQTQGGWFSSPKPTKNVYLIIGSNTQKNNFIQQLNKNPLKNQHSIGFKGMNCHNIAIQKNQPNIFCETPRIIHGEGRNISLSIIRQMVDTENKAREATNYNFRFFILENCNSREVEPTFTLLETMFGDYIFDSATLILKDCPQDSYSVQHENIAQLAVEKKVKIFEWPHKTNIHNLISREMVNRNILTEAIPYNTSYLLNKYYDQQADETSGFFRSSGKYLVVGATIAAGAFFWYNPAYVGYAVGFVKSFSVGYAILEMQNFIENNKDFINIILWAAEQYQQYNAGEEVDKTGE